MAYGDVISVAGALILFFSWLSMNVLVDRLKSAKDAFHANEGAQRLLIPLNDIRSMQDSLAAEVLNLRRTMLEDNGARHLDPNDLARERRMLDFALWRLNARQIHHGCMNTVAEERFGAGSIPSRFASKLIEANVKMIALRSEVDALLTSAGAALARPNFDEVAQTEVESARSAYSNHLLPRFALLLQDAVAAANAGREALREAMDRAQKRVKVAKSIATSLYILGTALTLTGAVLKAEAAVDDKAHVSEAAKR